jgi:hypothetical protein
VCATHKHTPRLAARSAEARARRAAQWVVERHAVPVPTDSVTAIYDELARCNGLIREYERQIAELPESRRFFHVTKVEDVQAGQGRPGRNTTFEAKPHPLVVLLGEERDRLARLAVDAARVDLDAKRLQLDAARSQLVVRLLDRLLVALGHDPHDPVTAAVVRDELRALPGGESL